MMPAARRVLTASQRGLREFYIGGQWVEPLGAGQFRLVNPSTEEELGTVAMGSAEDVSRAVTAAKTAFATYSQTTVEQRIGWLEELLRIYKSRYEGVAEAMTVEMGVPIKFSREMQADSGVGHLEAFIDALRKQELRTNLPNGDILVREPIGVCGLITPWNWPINQVVLKVIPALATGCTCILKPSEFTSMSAAMYAEMIHDAGFPAGAFNMVHGDGPTVGAALSSHPDVQMMSFTGSTRAGIAISKAAADTVKRVTLELGGKSPNLVFADCKLEERVEYSVLECFSNSGQSCDAPTRLLVERSCYDKVVQIAQRIGQEVKVGDPLEDGDHLGPVFSAMHWRRVQTLIEVGISEGARLLCGGLGCPAGLDRGFYVKPTIFADVDHDMRIAREEVFGPVLVLIPFDTEEEAIAMANDTPYGLAAYVQTGSRERAERVAAQLRAGAVHINGAAVNYGTPFGGYKQSGNGREAGMAGLEDYQELKSLHFGAF